MKPHAAYTQHKVEGGCSRTLISPRPLLRTVAPISSKPCGARGNLVPVVKNKEEVARSLPQAPIVTNRDGIPTEDLPE